MARWMNNVCLIKFIVVIICLYSCQRETFYKKSKSSKEIKETKEPKPQDLAKQKTDVTSGVCNALNLNICIERGKLAIDEGRFRPAIIRPLSFACSNKSIEACNLLKNYLQENCNRNDFATCHILGISVNLDLTGDEKNSFLTKACNGKHMQSCFEIGKIYSENGEIHKAQTQFRKACKGGISEACMQHADHLYASGKRDLSKKYLNRACSLDNSIGCYNLAARYRMSCGAKDKKSCHRMSSYLFKIKPGELFGHLGLDNSTVRALRFSCDKMRNREACYIIGEHHQRNKDRKQSISYFQRACKAGERKSCYNLGLIYSADGNQKRSANFLERACDLNHIMGCHNLLAVLEKSKNMKKYLSALNKTCGFRDDTKLNREEAAAITSACHLELIIKLKRNKQFNIIMKTGLYNDCLNKDKKYCSPYSKIMLIENNIKEYEKHAEMSCDYGITIDCIELGFWNLAKLNHKKAVSFFDKACANDEDISCMMKNKFIEFKDKRKVDTTKELLKLCDESALLPGCFYGGLLNSYSGKNGIISLFTKKTDQKIKLDENNLRKGALFEDTIAKERKLAYAPWIFSLHDMKIGSSMGIIIYSVIKRNIGHTKIAREILNQSCKDKSLMSCYAINLL